MAEEPTSLPDDILVGYVRGRLPQAEAARIAALAAERPEVAAEIALARALAVDVDAEAAGADPGELGWARISRALESEAAPRVAKRRPWEMAAAAVAAVLVWQVVAVPLLQEADPRYMPVSESPGFSPDLLVAFAPNAPEEQMRALLRAVRADVIGGPSAVGLWRLGFGDPEARDAALARLGSEPIVESVQAE